MLVGMVRNSIIIYSKASRVTVVALGSSRYGFAPTHNKAVVATKPSSVLLYYNDCSLRRSFVSIESRKRSSRGNNCGEKDSLFVKNTRNAAFGMVLCLYGTIAYLRETYGGKVPYSWQIMVGNNYFLATNGSAGAAAAQSTTTSTASDPTTTHNNP